MDRQNRLQGVVGLRELVVSQSGAQIKEIMNPDVIYMAANADQKEAARLMSRYDLASLPVLDDEGKMLGVIPYDDIVDVIEVESTEDIYRLDNVGDVELEPDNPVSEQIKGRLPWVHVNMVTALFASWVISNFEEAIAEVAILAAFQSIMAGLGGNSATQNVAMIVRSMALGKMESRTVTRIATRQILVGDLQGVAVGIVVVAGVALWQSSVYLGVILCLATFLYPTFNFNKGTVKWSQRSSLIRMPAAGRLFIKKII